MSNAGEMDPLREYGSLTGSVLVTGASGFLGEACVLDLLQAGYRVFAMWNSTPLGLIVPTSIGVKCDFTDREALLGVLCNMQPECVIHLGALSSTFKCEQDVELANLVNGSGCLVELVKQVCPDCLVVQASTDLVYDGETSPHSTESIVNPKNAYAASKVLAERNVSSLRRGYVLRLSNIIGVGHGKFLQFLEESLASRKVIGLRCDEKRSFVDIQDVVQIITSLVREFYQNKDNEGQHDDKTQRVFNVGGPAGLSRVDLAAAVASSQQVELVVCETKEEAEAKSKSDEQWVVFKQTNAEANAQSIVHSPRDVTMNSTETEQRFNVVFKSVSACIERIRGNRLARQRA